MKSILDLLSSTRLFIALAALLLGAFALGGLFPQGLAPQQYQEMFGRVGASLVSRLGLHNVFASGWFLALLGAAGLNLLACTAARWQLIKTRPGVFLVHVAVLLLFAGGLVRGKFRTGGTLAMQTGETHSGYTEPEGGYAALPFTVKLKDFKITYWEPEKHLVHALDDEGGVVETAEAREGEPLALKTLAQGLKVLKFYSNFSIGRSGPVSLDDSRANPALTLAPEKGKAGRPIYLFSRFPDYHGTAGNTGARLVYELRGGRVKQFVSSIDIMEGGQVVKEAALSVNSPLYYKGYRLYQSGFDEKNPRFSSIQVAKDPSVLVIYAGFALLMAGLTLAFRKELL